MSDPEQRPRFVAGDFSGGMASAVLSVTGNIAAGVVAFAPLGPEYRMQGIMAGMFSSIVAGLLASLSGQAPGMVSGPKATTAMAFATLLSQLLATGEFDTPARMELLLALAFSAVLISGSVQILLGAFRVGGLVRFMPYPVVAGIRNTTAILFISSQMWPLLGIDPDVVMGFRDIPGLVRPGAMAAGVLTAAIALRGGRWVPKPVVPVVALVAGTVVHHLVSAAGFTSAVGGQLEPIESALPSFAYTTDIVPALVDPNNFAFLGMVIFGALAMAVLDSVSALITLVSYQSIADKRFDANKQLVGQGIGSAASAFFGGLTNSGILARAAVNHGAGGRTRLSGVVNAVGVLILVVVLARPLGTIPEAAIAGLVMAIAYGLFDRWTVGQLREAFREGVENPRDNILAVGLMGFVVCVGVFDTLVTAVGAGVGASVVVFVAQMSRSPIRRVRTGASVRSARQRAEHLSEVLAEHGNRIAVIELEGSIFFGSSDALATRAEELVEGGADFVLMDLKRVRGVDATGYKVLGQTYQRLKARKAILAFSYVVPGTLNKEIAEDLMQAGVPELRMFESSDRALEYFEEGLLFQVGITARSQTGWTLEQFGDAWGLTGRENEALGAYVDQKHFESGEFVFREGDTSRSMFLLCRGDADVSIPVEKGRRRRLATFQEGTVFGEMALLDGAPRAAGISGTGPLDVYEMTYDAYQRLLREEPELALKIQAALGRILGARVRGANALIHELDS